MKIMYTNDVDSFILKDKVDESKPDVRTETKLSKDVKSQVVFPEGSQDERRQRGRSSLLVSDTITFQEVMVNGGPLTSIFWERMKSLQLPYWCSILHDEETNQINFLINNETNPVVQGAPKVAVQSGGQVLILKDLAAGK